MIRSLAGVAAISVMVLLDVSTSVADESGSQDWQFTDNSNPAEPTVSSNASGIASAEIGVGYLSSGWLASLSGFGNENGIWDLGFQNPDDPGMDTRGWVQLSIPNPAHAANGLYTDLILRTVQFVDGFIYKGSLTFSLPSGQYMGRTIVESLPGSLGGDWVEDEYRWRMAPGLEHLSLSITGAANGTVIGRIRIDTVGPVTTKPEALVINSIEKRNHALAISWAGGRPPYGVYTTSNLLSIGSWQQVGPLVTGTNAEVALIGPVGFIRVRGSD
jgi:hypothetical protein